MSTLQLDDREPKPDPRYKEVETTSPRLRNVTFLVVGLVGTWGALSGATIKTWSDIVAAPLWVLLVAVSVRELVRGEE